MCIIYMIIYDPDVVASYILPSLATLKFEFDEYLANGLLINNLKSNPNGTRRAFNPNQQKDGSSQKIHNKYGMITELVNNILYICWVDLNIYLQGHFKCLTLIKNLYKKEKDNIQNHMEGLITEYYNVCKKVELENSPQLWNDILVLTPEQKMNQYSKCIYEGQELLIQENVQHKQTSESTLRSYLKSVLDYIIETFLTNNKEYV